MRDIMDVGAAVLRDPIRAIENRRQGRPEPRRLAVA
jgi:hypothetical protein